MENSEGIASPSIAEMDASGQPTGVIQLLPSSLARIGFKPGSALLGRAEDR